MQCTFVATGKKGDVCERCGTVLPFDVQLPLFWKCKGKVAKPRPRAERRPKLGDRIAAALSAIGITPESWGEFKEQFGLPPGCNCAARREWLNRFGERFGKVAQAAISLIR